MGKISRGSKGSTSLKIRIVAGIGTVSLVIIGVGYGLADYIKDIVSGDFKTFPDDVPGQTYIDPDKQFGTDSETLYKTEETAETVEHATFEEEENVSVMPGYQELLGNLTLKAQEYCANNRTSLAKIEMTGINNVQIEGSQVLVKGDFKNGTQLGNYIFTMTNEQNQDLKIFNTEGDSIETSDFITAVNEILNDESTTFSLDARQRLIDFSQIDKEALVKNITKGLTNAGEIKNLQDNLDTTDFSLLLNGYENGTYTYTLVAYSKERVYALVSSFTSDSNGRLSTSTLTNKIKDHIVDPETVFTTRSVETTKFEKALHNAKHARTSSVATVEETVALSRY